MASLNTGAFSSIQNAINSFTRYNQEISAQYKTFYDSTLEKIDSVYAIPLRIETGITPELVELRTMLNNIFKKSRTTGFIKEIRALEQNTNEIIKHFEQYKGIYAESSSKILSRLDSIERIHEIIQNMKVIAKEIKLFSINSVIVASQAGSQGVGFKSISRFIIELSDAIQKAAIQLEVYRDKILQAHSILHSNFEHLINNIYNKKVGEVRAKVSSSIEKIQAQFVNLTTLVEDVHKRLDTTLQHSEEIKKSNSSGARRFNVLRYFENAIFSIAEFGDVNLSEEGNENELLKRMAYFHHVIKNLKKRLDVSVPQLEIFRDGILKTYNELINIFGGTQQDQIYILNYMSTPISKSKGIVNEIFDDTTAVIKEVQNLIAEESSVKEKLMDTFLEMEKIHQEGLSFFSSFEKFFVTMNNINVLAQIEMSKTSFDSSNNQNLKAKFVNMLSNIKDFNTDIKTHIQKMLMSLLSELNAFSEINSSQSQSLGSSVTFLDSHMLSIEYIHLNLLRHIKTIKDENPKIFASETVAKKNVTDFFDTANTFLPFLHNMTKEVRSQEERFDGLINYYNINIKIHNLNNQFIESYEKQQKQYS